MAEKITKEIALGEVSAWLDYKKIGDQKRETQKDQINSLVDAVVDGSLSFKDDKSIVLELKFPIGKDLFLKQMVFKPRLNMRTITAQLQGVKATDFDGRLLAYVAALSDQTKTILGDLDTEDFGLCQSVALFFI